MITEEDDDDCGEDADEGRPSTCVSTVVFPRQLYGEAEADSGACQPGKARGFARAWAKVREERGRASLQPALRDLPV